MLVIPRQEMRNSVAKTFPFGCNLDLASCRGKPPELLFHASEYGNDLIAVHLYVQGIKVIVEIDPRLQQEFQVGAGNPHMEGVNGRLTSCVGTIGNSHEAGATDDKLGEVGLYGPQVVFAMLGDPLKPKGPDAVYRVGHWRKQ